MALSLIPLLPTFIPAGLDSGWDAGHGGDAVAPSLDGG